MPRWLSDDEWYSEQNLSQEDAERLLRETRYAVEGWLNRMDRLSKAANVGFEVRRIENCNIVINLQTDFEQTDETSRRFEVGRREGVHTSTGDMKDNNA